MTDFAREMIADDLQGKSKELWGDNAPASYEDAREGIEWIQRDRSRIHRGALQWDFDRTLLFGNDGYSSDPRTRWYVELLRRTLEAEGRAIVEIATSSGQSSWAILFEAYEADEYDDLVWVCFWNSRGWTTDAIERIMSSRTTPEETRFLIEQLPPYGAPPTLDGTPA